MVKRIQWTHDLINKFWDGVAQTELDNLSFGKVAGPQFLELIDKYLIQGCSYLDFGAGSGHVMQLLLNRGLNVAGFDPSPDRQASLINKIGQHKNFLGIKGIESEEQFDVVLLMEVVEHVLEEDFSTVLAKVANFVKPGGYIIVSTPNNENLESSSVYCPVSDTLFHPWQHIRSFTPSQLSDCLKKVGFKKDFLALADFSCDAEQIETYKRIVAIDKLKLSSRQHLSASIKSSIEEIKKYRKNLEKLGFVDSTLRTFSKLSIFQRIKLRLAILMCQKSHISALHSISHDIAYQFDELFASVLDNVREIMVIDAADDTSRLLKNDIINLRIGRETTIVYVGKKNR